MRRKKGRIIALGILFLLLAVGVAVAVMQWNNIQALRYAKTYTPQQRQALLEENQEEIQRILEKFPEVHVSPLSEEQEQQLRNGELSEEEALLLIQGETPGSREPSEQTAAPEGDNADAQTPAAEPAAENADSPEKSGEQQLQELFAKVYLLRSGFSGRLDDLIGEAKQEYTAKNGNIDKAAFAKEYLAKGSALESACDAEMEKILGQISEILKETGGDTGTVDEIRRAYQNEKSIQKAVLMDQYQ